MKSQQASALTGLKAAAMVHRMYELHARSIKLRLKGFVQESEALHEEAMRIADFVRMPASAEDDVDDILERIGRS